MSEPFVAEIRAFGFNFAPYQWAQCLGQIVSIQQYAALFSLVGTSFGGNGSTNFGLPNLQGTVPMHWGNGAGLSQYVLGEVSGTPTVTLNTNTMPMHNHTIQAAEPAGGSSGEETGTPGPTAWFGVSAPARLYVSSGTATTPLSPKSITPSGGSQAHQNMQPYQAVSFCIALAGVYPSRS